MATSLSNFDGYGGYLTSLVVEGTPPDAAFMRKFYRMLHAYYGNNGLYDYINNELRETRITNDDVKPLRNPAYRVVEFYAAKMFPGPLPQALPITADNENIVPAIEQIWSWSNFASRKQRIARWMATYGDLILKVQVRRGGPDEDARSVYFQPIQPEYVTDIEADERGFVTYIRLDIPNGDEMHTEVWDKATQEWRVWVHEQGWDVDLDRITVTPDRGTFDEAIGEDFVPFVYQMFRDDGAGRGNGAFTAQLDKIDEANRQASRLGQMLFRYNRALWALMANAVDSSGRPLPAPSVSGILNSDDELDLEDDTMVELPGMSRLEPLVPNINYESALAILQDTMAELKADLPELAYYDMRDFNEISGRAARFLLDDAISRLIEARGNAEHAIRRADEMALTIGQNVSLFDESLGSFEDGDFSHSFDERAVLPLDGTEQAQAALNWRNAGLSVPAALRAAGVPEEEAAEMAGERRLIPDEDVL